MPTVISESGIYNGIQGQEFEVIFDYHGGKLWINASDGSAVARFNKRTGVDVHNSSTDQLNGAPECLWCTHGVPDQKTWVSFIEAVNFHYELTIATDSLSIGKKDL